MKIHPGLKQNVQTEDILHLYILVFISGVWLRSGPGSQPFGDHAAFWKTQAGAVLSAQPQPVQAQPSPPTHSTQKSACGLLCSAAYWCLSCISYNLSSFLSKGQYIFHRFFFFSPPYFKISIFSLNLLPNSILNLWGFLFFFFLLQAGDH